ncbi:PucR family transcriptional regulator [Pseudonocardia endophytica]|uniref:PucR-like helix-turn-helix protein n=1 Tax=Pseudonocardia endophytica TaxID=401976 RepID=A0A4R1I4J1_PSEEN|nr:PucR family transcriptional regulator [Pseudonocardia endophytica]TCK27489.1 PucR-like helix-turn-helix protein [Pseudonocardia endophytica]
MAEPAGHGRAAVPRTRVGPDVGAANEGDEALTTLCRALREDVDGLADRLTVMILEREDVYGELGVPIDTDLRATCRANIDRTLAVLAGDLPTHVERARVTVETGQRRVRQGVPLEVVLRAYRLCGRLLWERMCRISSDRFDGRFDRALLGAADRVWALIDSASDRLVDAYRREEAQLRSLDDGRRYSMTEGLLQGRGRDPAFARDASRVLGLPEHQDVVIVVAPHADGVGSDGAGAPEGAREALAAAGIGSVWHTRPGEVVGVVPVPARVTSAVCAALGPCARGPIGVSSPVTGLDRLDEAHSTARLAAATLPAGEPAVAALDDRLPEALLTGSPELAQRIRRHALGPLLDLPAAERDVLLDTLAATLDADGSPSRAASVLYCHRNTVMYRLARIETLTGRRIADHRDRLLMGLGLLAG